MGLDRKLAEEPYYRHYDRRFMCKKIGHGSNYGGKPRTLANQAHVEQDLIEDFQSKYFSAFPAHQRWHDYVNREVRERGYLISLTGRKRHFWGRRDDPKVLREAIAYDPQGSLADILNHGMLNVWKDNTATLLMQIHDAILFQYPQEAEDEIVPLVLDQLRYPIQLENGREFVIPYGIKTGWNWGKYDGKTNPKGLKDYKGRDEREWGTKTKIMDRRIREICK